MYAGMLFSLVLLQLSMPYDLSSPDSPNNPRRRHSDVILRPTGNPK